MRFGRRPVGQMLLTLLALWPAAAIAAEPLPLPSVDYAAHGTFIGGGTMTIRHHGGTLRTDMTMPGTPMPMTGYFDLATKKALMVVSTPAGPMAMEVNLADQVGYGAMTGTGVREGRDAVAGEPCDIWRIETSRPEEPVRSCITADGIALRTDAVVGGKSQTVFEIAGVTRGAQNPADLRMPARRAGDAHADAAAGRAAACGAGALTARLPPPRLRRRGWCRPACRRRPCRCRDRPGRCRKTPWLLWS